MIQALVFDMDGLIFDSERIVQKSWQLTGEELGLPDMGKVIYRTLGFNRKRRMEFFRAHISPDFPEEEFARKTRMYFRKLVEKDGVPVKKGIRGLLGYAKKNGYKLAVATSSSEDYAKELFLKAGLYMYFDTFVYGTMVKNSKPDPECYFLACKELEVNPKDAVALEDAPSGILAAHAAGMRTIVIPDLVEPPKELDKLIWHVCRDAEEALILLEKEKGIAR